MVQKSIEQWADALVNEDNVKVTISVVPDESNPDAEYTGDWVIQSGGGATLPIPKANIFSSAPPGANVDILGADIVPTNSPSTCRVAFVTGIDTVVKSRVTQGATTVDAYLNDSVALVSGSLYIFDIMWESGDALNFQFETDGMVQVLKAHEIGAL